MHFGNFIHFGAAAIMAVGQAEAWIPYSKLAVPRSNTTSVRSNVTVHGTTDLIVKTLNHTTYTIFSPVITGEPATAVLSSVATLTLTALVPHKSKNQKREVTAVVALGGYGTPSSTWSSNTQAAEGVSGAGLSCSTCACVHVTETVQITTVASVTATVTVTAGSTTPSLLSTDQSSNTAGTAGVTGTANSISTTSTTSSSRYSTTTTTGNTMISASGTTAPSETGTLSGLTVPPAQSETSGPEASATHQSDGGRSLHTSTWSLTGLVMGTSLFSIALAFLVAV